MLRQLVNGLPTLDRSMKRAILFGYDLFAMALALWGAFSARLGVLFDPSSLSVWVAAPASFYPAYPLDEFNRYANRSAPIPFYYPGEIALIRAEALTNLGRLPEAADAVNAVRTKCNAAPTGDPEACLPPLPLASLATPAELLAEIYTQRRFELFATGLRWEDVRRLGQVGAGLSAQRCWLLYPDSERQTNPQTPADPESPDAPSGPKSCGV